MDARVHDGASRELGRGEVDVRLAELGGLADAAVEDRGLCDRERKGRTREGVGQPSRSTARRFSSIPFTSAKWR